MKVEMTLESYYECFTVAGLDLVLSLIIIIIIIITPTTTTTSTTSTYLPETTSNFFYIP